MCGTDNKSDHRCQSTVDIVSRQRPKRHRLAEINSHNVTRLQTARHLLSPRQRDVNHHDNRPTANHSVVGSWTNEAAPLSASAENGQYVTSDVVRFITDVFIAISRDVYKVLQHMARLSTANWVVLLFRLVQNQGPTYIS